MFDTLSETQCKVVFEKEGKVVVMACPGSGKTYSVAARLADRMSKWPLNYQGIATISFTNAAWQEIERQVTTHFNIAKPIPYPHFLGTIDSFVNRFIFLPFGHLIMGCSDRPVLVGEPHGPWSGKWFVDGLFPKPTLRSVWDAGNAFRFVQWRSLYCRMIWRLLTRNGALAAVCAPQNATLTRSLFGIVRIRRKFRLISRNSTNESKNKPK